MLWSSRLGKSAKMSKMHGSVETTTLRGFANRLLKYPFQHSVEHFVSGRLAS